MIDGNLMTGLVIGLVVGIFLGAAEAYALIRRIG